MCMIRVYRVTVCIIMCACVSRVTVSISPSGMSIKWRGGQFCRPTPGRLYGRWRHSSKRRLNWGTFSNLSSHRHRYYSNGQSPMYITWAPCDSSLLYCGELRLSGVVVCAVWVTVQYYIVSFAQIIGYTYNNLAHWGFRMIMCYWQSV